MKEINIIPIEGHQTSLSDDLVQASEQNGLIDALKKYSQSKLKKDREIKITKEELDGEKTYLVSIIVGNTWGGRNWPKVSLFDVSFDCYQDAIDFKRKINAWVESGAKTHKPQEPRYVVWEKWYSVSSGNISDIHVTKDLKRTLCNKPIPYAGELTQRDHYAPGGLHAEHLGNIPESGWDRWEGNKNEKTISVAYHKKLSDFNYTNSLATRFDSDHPVCQCCLKRSA